MRNNACVSAIQPDLFGFDAPPFVGSDAFIEAPSLRAVTDKDRYGVALTPEIRSLLSENAPVAIGVSGGKDSAATGIRLNEYLEDIGHAGPRVLIHSDLGRVEWRDSLPACERLARRIGWELVIVRRAAGDMMDRWESRWTNSLRRYQELSCVKLILPWSTPSMRFCTSELKTEIICSDLARRYPGRRIISAVGVRHQESAARAKMPTCQVQPKLSRRGASGVNWNPIIEWSTPDVYSYLAEKNEPLHEAYCRYGCTRVSCAFCIMSSAGDLAASSACESNADIYRLMVNLEIRSTYAFQGAKWLGDVAPHLLSVEEMSGLVDAKRRGQARIAAEKMIPKHLMFSSGWPTVMPTRSEAVLLGQVRRTVSELIGIPASFTDADEIVDRFRFLIESKSRKTASGKTSFSEKAVSIR